MQDRAARSGSLVASIARRILLVAALSAAIVTGISWLIVTQRAEQQALADLTQYIDQRGRAESQIFRAAESNLAAFETRFLALYTDPEVFPSPDFDAYYFEDAEGAIRLRPEYFHGSRAANGVMRTGTSGFMGRKRPPLTDELKRRMVLSYEMAATYGPGWVPKFANFHISLPENALINHWPDEPWGMQADADLDMTAGKVIRSTLQTYNRDRRPVWSGLYYDLTVDKWAITYQRPIDHDGRHLVNPSHDILLDDLIGRLIADHPEGGRNLILARNGDLIAQPERLDDMRQHQGVLNVAGMGDPQLLAIYNALEQHAAAHGAGHNAHVVHSRELDAYIAFTRIAGPDWWFVTVYPRALVTAEAREGAAIVLLLGLILSGLITFYVLYVLRVSVAKPIRQLKTASERIAAGGYDAVAGGSVPLPDGRDDEIGLLARSFRAMAGKVGDANAHLEQTVQARTVELQLANRKLEKLSLRDSLTGAFNRRAFDADIAEAIRRADEQHRASALLMCDLDHFKAYNDSYGHPAGDQILSFVVNTIERCVPAARIYRYGGEEIAVVLDPEEMDCHTAAAAIVRRVAALAIPHCESPFGMVTISAGLAFTGEGVASAADFIRAADVELYRAKKAGRNRLASAGDRASESGLPSAA